MGAQFSNSLRTNASAFYERLLTLLGNFNTGSNLSPIKGCLPRLKNIFKCHFRGIFGIVVPAIICGVMGGHQTDHWKTVQTVWVMMFCSILFHPVNVPVSGFIPLFIFPLCGVMDTQSVTKCYFNDTIGLLIIAGMLSLLVNNSGLDKRIALYFLCKGDNCEFGGKKLITKASIASFILSIVSNRLIVCINMYNIIMQVFEIMPTERRRKIDPDFPKIRDIINNAVQTSSVLGSIVVVHGSYTTLAFKGMYRESTPEQVDVFNYLQYTAFTLPVAMIMLFVNILYHKELICNNARMTVYQLADLRGGFLRQKKELMPITHHEKLSLIFLIIAYILMFLRYSQWTGFLYTRPGVSDCTIAGIIVLLSCMLPKEYFFYKYVTATTKEDLPPRRPTSAILWWKYLDQNINYAYTFLVGAGIALYMAIFQSGLSAKIQSNIEPAFDKGWNFSIFAVVAIAGLMANIMTGIGSCILLSPILLCFTTTTTWQTRTHLGALGIGLASSFGFMHPFRYTPAFYCYNTGKIPRHRMIGYSTGSVFLFIVILWIALCFYSPFIWPDLAQIPMNTTTTPSPPAANP